MLFKLINLCMSVDMCLHSTYYFSVNAGTFTCYAFKLLLNSKIPSRFAGHKYENYKLCVNL